MKSTRPVAVITGAARGIGKGCALELARGGFNLLINDLPDADSVEKLHITQQECIAEGVEVICFPADVGDLSLHEEMLDAAQNQWGRLDCLLNNAGISVKKRGDLLDLEPDSFDQNIAINTRAPFFLAQALVPEMMRQGWGRIINIASLQSSRAFPNGLPYGASKGGIAQLTRGMAEAWSRPGTGITANAIAPGFFKTQLTAPLFDKPEVVEALARQTTMNRVGFAEDIQGLTMFLASPASGYITGQVIHIDGGWTAI